MPGPRIYTEHPIAIHDLITLEARVILRCILQRETILTPQDNLILHNTIGIYTGSHQVVKDIVLQL